MLWISINFLDCSWSIALEADHTLKITTILASFLRWIFPILMVTIPSCGNPVVRTTFDMYSVEPTLRVKVASMHFERAAARWLWSVEHQLLQPSWESFCDLVVVRFGRDQLELLVRKFFYIKQTGHVVDYIEQFFELLTSFAPMAPTLTPCTSLYWWLAWRNSLCCNCSMAYNFWFC